ncbi:MAG TPA: hydroxyacid dehydrogenase [Acidimicrobiia bacterium]|nr:hydroxyacid dehydrogenase [Acidimicrobiia bacterium]
MSPHAGEGSPPPLVLIPEYLPDPNLEQLADRVDVVYDPDLHANRDGLLSAIGPASAVLIRNRTVVDEALIRSAPALKVVGRLGVGLDNVDVAALERSEVELIVAKGGNAVSVAEYVIAAMLVCQRGVFGMTRSMLAGEWPRQGHAFGREMKDKTLGLVGFGSIAREVAKRAAGLEMRILAHDPYLNDDDAAWGEVEPVGFEDLLTRSDVVSIHVPLDEQTRGLIDAGALAAMREGATLINTSRGGIVDEAALAAALRSGEIGSAALDVFSTEPLGPEAAATFEGLDNLVLTPHLAGNAIEAVDRIATSIVEAVLDVLSPR